MEAGHETEFLNLHLSEIFNPAPKTTLAHRLSTTVGHLEKQK